MLNAVFVSEYPAKGEEFNNQANKQCNESNRMPRIGRVLLELELVQCPDGRPDIHLRVRSIGFVHFVASIILLQRRDSHQSSTVPGRFALCESSSISNTE
eukprot:scaffold1820_cov129-Cylindrotheca_fusiformis.AAC.11